MRTITSSPKAAVTPVATTSTGPLAISQADNRAGTVQAKGLLKAIDESPRQVAQQQVSEAVVASARRGEQQPAVLPQASPANRTGLPDSLKAGVENLSGHSLDDVRVHYNSSKPAQLQAHAYAQGSEIHIAPGQEKHLAHEAWHVVQQKQGRVRATRQLQKVAVNDSHYLEREADTMGRLAASTAPGIRQLRRAMPAGTSLAGVVQRVTEAQDIPMWVPAALANATEIYAIDASHRGDMYHLRAVQAVKPLPLLIFNATKSNDLIEYLKLGNEKVGQPVAIVGWNPLEKAAAPPEEKKADYVDRTKAPLIKVLSESAATAVLAKAAKPADTAGHMSILSPELKEEIEKLLPKIFKEEHQNGALLMFRDSGQNGGVYPELDSGGALPELAEMIHHRGFTPIICGFSGNTGGIPSIGAYREYLNFGQPALKRDIEAYFMHIAHEKKYYRVVVGFRSGALDSYTFMNIPTISLSLNELVGEARHNQLVGPKWNRTNVLYDMPRHEDTAQVKLKKGGQAFMSPASKFNSDIKPKSDPTRPPGGFHPLDKRLIGKGLEIGLSRLEPKGIRHQGAVTRDSLRDALTVSAGRFGATPEEEDAIMLQMWKELSTAKAAELEELGQVYADPAEKEKKLGHVAHQWDEKIKGLMASRKNSYEKAKENAKAKKLGKVTI